MNLVQFTHTVSVRLTLVSISIYSYVSPSGFSFSDEYFSHLSHSCYSPCPSHSAPLIENVCASPYLGVAGNNSTLFSLTNSQSKIKVFFAYGKCIFCTQLHIGKLFVSVTKVPKFKSWTGKWFTIAGYVEQICLLGEISDSRSEVHKVDCFQGRCSV